MCLQQGENWHLDQENAFLIFGYSYKGVWVSIVHGKFLIQYMGRGKGIGVGLALCPSKTSES